MSKSPITTNRSSVAHQHRGPAGWQVHPGEILRHEFLQPLGLSGYALAKAIGVKLARIRPHSAA